ncbi:MAG: hypothetical protein ACRC0Y_07015 [Fusobacteriaceae bacterium]
MSKFNKKNTILNQHSALTTFKLNKGGYYKIGVEKAIFSLLLKSQTELRTTFREMILEKGKELLTSEEHEYFLNWIYSGKDVHIELDKINLDKLSELSHEILSFREKEINERTQDTLERIKLFSNIKESSLFKAFGHKDAKNILELKKKSSGLNKFEIHEKDISEIFKEIRAYYKDVTIKKYLDVKTIDFTTLAIDIGTNPTNLKSDMKKAAETVLEFNYINKKNLDIEIVSSLIASVRFTKDKLKHITWLTYQIPREILELLLIPEIYVPLEGMVIHNLSGTYTIRMYGFLKDHMKRGEVELSKEELFNFFGLPTSYQNNKNSLVKKFLIPTLQEVKESSGIHTEYKFFPEKRSYEKIYFYPSLREKISAPEIKIVTNENRNLDILENEKILKAIEQAKKNIYVQKSWDKRTNNKITKIYQIDGEKFTVEVLNDLYQNLHNSVQTTLVQYINGILKNKKSEINISKEKVSKMLGIKELLGTENKFINNVQEAEIVTKEIPKEQEITEDKNILGNIIYGMFQKMDEVEREKIRESAKELFKKKTGLKTLDSLNLKFYEASEKNLIVEVLKKLQ